MVPAAGNRSMWKMWPMNVSGLAAASMEDQPLTAQWTPSTAVEMLLLVDEQVPHQHARTNTAVRSGAFECTKIAQNSF